MKTKIIFLSFSIVFLLLSLRIKAQCTPPAPALITHTNMLCSELLHWQDPGIPPVIDPSICWQVCMNSTVVYEVAFNASSTYQWVVTGSSPNVVNSFTPNGNQCTVHYVLPGSATVTVTETNTGCSSTVSHCVNVLQKPVANFLLPNIQHDNVLNQDYIELCQWGSLNFLNASYDPASASTNLLYLWDFGDGATSIETSPTHIFSGASEFIVTLTIINACGCTDSKSIHVRMRDGLAAEISCATPACSLSTASYTVNASGCSSYSWSVINGTLLSPANSNYVQVTWNNGASGPGVLSFSGIGCSGTCPATASITVPIYSATFLIEGPLEVCPEPQVAYSVQNVPGTTYSWSLSPTGPGDATLVGDLCSNEVVIDWTDAKPGDIYTLSVDYTDPMLPCGSSGSSTLDILVGTPFTILGPVEICNGANATFNISAANLPPSPVFTWKIKVVHPDGTSNAYLFSSQSGTSLSFIPWTYGIGTVSITAIDNSTGYFFCENDHKETTTMKVNGAALPTTPAGDQLVCAGTSHAYTSVAATGNYLNWAVIGSTGVSPLTGNNVTINWGAPSYSISLSQVDMATGCISDPVVYTVTERTPVVPVVTGDFTPCTNSRRTYTVTNLSSLHASNIKISVTPAEAGSMISFTGNEIRMQWNNNPYPLCSLVIAITTCGVETNNYYPVSLTGSPSLTVTQNTTPPFCEGNQISFTSSPAYIPGATTYSWDFGDGNFQTNTSTNATHIYDLNGGIVPVQFNVVVTATSEDLNCQTTGSVSITVYPNPRVGITSSKNCLPVGGNVQLTANVSGGPGGPLTYSWSGPGGFTGSTQSVTATVAGLYFVTVSNTFNTCMASTSFTLNACGCSTDPDIVLNISYTHSATECHTIQFNGVFTNNGTNTLTASPYFWDFGDGFTSTAQNPQHTYSESSSNRNPCFTLYTTDGTTVFCTSGCLSITFPDFGWDISCPAVPGQNYNVVFTGTDPFANASPTYTWWNGSINIGSGPLPTLSTSFSQGSYQIMFETSSAQHCTITKTFNMPLALTAAFTATPGPYCEDQTEVQITADAGHHYHSYFWSYGEYDQSVPAIQAQYLSYNNHFTPDYNLSNHVFVYPTNLPPFYVTVSLTVTDVFGCTNSSSVNYTIHQMNLGGTVVATPPQICPGSSSLLHYERNIPTFPGIPDVYTWSTGATTATITTQQTGQYNVTVHSNSSGCSFMPEAPANVHVYNIPIPMITGERDICYGDYVKLSGNAGPAYDYYWNIGGLVICCGTSTTEPAIKAFPISAPGTYPVSLTITDAASACSLTTSANLTLHNLPANPALITNPVPACPATLFNLEVTNNTGAPPYYVNWSNGGFGNTTSTAFAGIYRATFTDAYNCELGFGDIVVPDAPDLSWVLTGCYEMCSSETFAVPGKSCVDYDQWEWVMLNTNSGGPSYSINGSGAVSEFVINSTTFPAIAPGVYEIILNVTDNGCYYFSVFKMTVSGCGKCSIESQPVNVNCLYLIDRVAVYSFRTEFFFSAPVNSPFTADFIALSPASGLSISSTSTINPMNPNSIIVTGTITCDLMAISPPFSLDYQFTYTYNDLASGVFFLCSTASSFIVPECTAIPDPCPGFDIADTRIVCNGLNLFGNREYTIDFSLPGIPPSPPYTIYYYSPDVTLSGFPSSVSGNPGPYTATFTDEHPFLAPGQPACIFMYFVDYDTDPFNPTTCYIDECFALPDCDIFDPDPCDPVPCDERLAFNGSTKPGIGLFPNPAQEQVTVSWQVPGAGKWKIMISDMKGSAVYEFALPFTEATVNIDLSNYKPGVYFISLVGEQDPLLVRKLVVIK